MTIMTLAELKEKHEKLHSRIISKATESTAKINRDNQKKLYQEITSLTDDIIAFSETVDSFEDYRWLSDAAVKWQSVYSTIFGTPRIIILKAPQKPWLRPQPLSVLHEEEIEDWVRSHAAFIAFARRTESQKEWASQIDDWHAAEVFFASEVLEGKLNFVKRISPTSYWRLEDIWVKEVKCLMAYFQWLPSKPTMCDPNKNFFDACNHLRNLLIDPGIKARIDEFGNIQQYIQAHYLNDQGKLAPTAHFPKLKELIRKKASRIFETTGVNDEPKNWIHAETYTRMFYENIIPAVTKKDSEKILRVLKAFQFSKMNRFLVINSFETALAIYFLDREIIQDLWEASRSLPLPESTVESIVDFSGWPRDFALSTPSRMRFWHDPQRIGFMGVMSPEERESILAELIRAMQGVPTKSQINALEELYTQTRLIHCETTL